MPLKNASLLRGLRSTFGVSRTTVSIWIKKKELSFRLCVPPCSPRSQRIPLPRCWNWTNGWLVCAQKGHDSWMWIVLCRKTRQVVAYAVGDRSKQTCQRLWEAIPQEYRQGQC